MNFEQLYDVSVALSNDLATWPGDPPINIEKASDMTRGDAANVSRLIMGVHTGTHMDAPHHFVDEMGGVDSFSLQALVGTALVVELNIDHHIGAADLEAAKLPEGTERVLFKTPNSDFWRDPTTFQKQFVAIAEDGAEWLVEHGLKLVGIDYLSIEKFDAPFDHPVHKILLGANIAIIEGLNLTNIQPGEYTLMALPVKIKNGDGAPARVLLAL